MQEIVDTARITHFTVLERAFGKVPDEAKPTIQQVISDSEEGLETFPATNSTATSGGQELNIKVMPDTAA